MFKVLYLYIIYKIRHTHTHIEKVDKDVRANWLWHLSPLWLSGLIQLSWLASQVTPSSLTTPCAPLLQLHSRLKRMTLTNRGSLFFC